MLTLTTIEDKYTKKFNDIHYYKKYYPIIPLNDNISIDKETSILKIINDIEKEVKTVIDIIGKMKKVNTHKEIVI